MELLGLFNPIPSSSNPGWIVKATSLITGKTWNIVVSMQKKKPFYYGWIVENVPWKTWQGIDELNPLMCGDNPDKYYDKVAKIKRRPKIY